MRNDEEAYGGTEVPRGMDTTDMVLLIQRAVREMQPQQPKVSINGVGWKVAAVGFGLLSTFLSALFAWGLSKIDSQGQKIDAVVADVAVIKCQLSSDCKKPQLERGAVND